MIFSQPALMTDASDYRVISSKMLWSPFSVYAAPEEQQDSISFAEVIPEQTESVTVKAEESAFIVTAAEKLRKLCISIQGVFRKIAEAIRCIFACAVRHFSVERRIFICSYQI